MTGIPATLDAPAIRPADDQLDAQAPRLVDAAKSWVLAEA